MDPTTIFIIIMIASVGRNDVYDHLKAVLRRKFGRESRLARSFDDLEANPDSPVCRQILEEELRAVKLDEDPEILLAVQLLRERMGFPLEKEEEISDTDINIRDFGFVAGPCYSINCSENFSIVSDKEGGRLYRVWFGTNRKPVAKLNEIVGFCADRETNPRTTHYGFCEVAIPKCHREIGSVGSSWWRRWMKLKDDRLKLKLVSTIPEPDFWTLVKKELDRWRPKQRRVLVYFHGYNVTFKEAAIRAAQIGFDLKVKGAMAFFSWPSKGAIEGYPADEAVIDASEIGRAHV